MNSPIDIEALRAELDELDELARLVGKCPEREARLRAQLDEACQEIEQSRDMRLIATNLVAELVRLFGWSDPSPLHAVLHVENAVNNLRADLAVAQHHVATLTAKLDAAERAMTRAHLDDLLARVEQGARAVERDKVVAWLRDGADIVWEPASLQIADAIEQQDHLREWGKK